MRPRRHVQTVLRERQAAVAHVLLNRALRRRKSPLDRLITRLVLTQVPEVRDDAVGGGPAQRGRLDAPPR